MLFVISYSSDLHGMLGWITLSLSLFLKTSQGFCWLFFSKETWVYLPYFYTSDVMNFIAALYQL